MISPIILPRAEATTAEDPSEDPDVGVAPEFPLTMSMVRETLAARRRARHDPNLHFLDGRELFGADDVADLPDGTHPNAADCQRIGERFAATAFGPGGAFP